MVWSVRLLSFYFWVGCPNMQDFWTKLIILQGNGCKKKAKIVLSKSIFYVKHHMTQLPTAQNQRTCRELNLTSILETQHQKFFCIVLPDYYVITRPKYYISPQIYHILSTRYLHQLCHVHFLMFLKVMDKSAEMY